MGITKNGIFGLNVVSVLVWLGLAASVHGEIRFQEVTEQAGFNEGSIRVPSWGACWGDFNGDFWPEMWVPRHHWDPKLYLNNGDGTFTNITDSVLPEGFEWDDTHGAAWADFDNDGDQDLIQLVGGGSTPGPNNFFISGEWQLQDQAAAMGMDFPGRGRTPLWLDWDGDGLLDILVNVEQSGDDQDRPSALFRQSSSGFQDVSELVGLDFNTAEFGLLSDLSADGRPEVLIRDLSDFPEVVYDTTIVPFVDLRTSLGIPSVAHTADAVAADFNNDLRPDLYIVRGRANADVVQGDANTLGAVLPSARDDDKGFSFRTTGDVLFKLLATWKITQGLSSVFIGSAGQHPTKSSFTLSPTDPAVWGIFDHTPGVDRAVYIGYDPVSQRWQLLISKYTGNLRFVVVGANPLSDIAAIGFDPSIPPPRDTLLVRGDGGFEDHTAAAGIATPSWGVNVAAGDFDNDMDLDVYIVSTRAFMNRPNILYENLGDGTFAPVLDAGGAAGSSQGNGGVVAMADYDGDGFLDLFLTNSNKPVLLGGDPPVFGKGPNQLFRNLGNDNHWIELDLEGVVSNRDAIGARILATAGGITQLREQGGGSHQRGAQNHKRIHFGLADQVAVDSLVIEWPSGITQEIGALPVDQLVRLVEPSTPTVLGQPSFQVGVSEGVFLWKDTVDGPYHLRVLGAGERTTFNIKLLSDLPVVEVQAQRLEPNDQLLQGEFGFALSAVLSTGQDGVDFRVPADARALLSVERDGVANPRQLHVGASGAPLSPGGWIKPVDELSPRPDLPSREAFGLFIGQRISQSVIEARWSGDSFRHQADLTLMAAVPFADVQGVKLESNDDLQSTANAVRIQGPVLDGWDGVDITLLDGGDLGLAYAQDGLFQSHRVNNPASGVGQPNAYWLPLARP